MSILALYYRIGSGKRGLPWIVQAPAVWATAGLMTAFTVAIFLAQLLACIPISRAWDVEAQPQGCIQGETFMQVSAAINVGMDVVLLLFPLPLLPLLKFNRKQRSQSPNYKINVSVTDSLTSCTRPHLWPRPHSRRRQHNAPLRNRHVRKPRLQRHALAHGRFKLVPQSPPHQRPLSQLTSQTGCGPGSLYGPKSKSISASWSPRCRACIRWSNKYGRVSRRHGA
jgi:hypothetical protein